MCYKYYVNQKRLTCGGGEMKLEQLEKSNRLFETYKFCLTPSQKQVLGLLLVDGLQTTEIAEILGTTKQAISKNVVVAQKKLQNMENNLQFLAFQDKIKQDLLELKRRSTEPKVQAKLKKMLKEL